jgi:hypothetical protein
VLDHRAARARDVVDADRHVGETGLVHDPLAVGQRCGARTGEVQELEHEAVAPEVARGHADGHVQAQQPVRRLVVQRDLAPQLEAQHLDVEGAAAFQVRDALPDVVEDAHGRILAHAGTRLAFSTKTGYDRARPLRTQ